MTREEAHMAAMLRHLGAAYYDRFAVLTPTNKLDPTSAQEFLTTTTPEPEENVLLGLGLLALGVAVAWRRHAAVG